MLPPPILQASIANQGLGIVRWWADAPLEQLDEQDYAMDE